MTDYQKVEQLLTHLDLKSDKNKDWFIKHILWALQSNHLTNERPLDYNNNNEASTRATGVQTVEQQRISPVPISFTHPFYVINEAGQSECGECYSQENCTSSQSSRTYITCSKVIPGTHNHPSTE